MQTAPTLTRASRLAGVALVVFSAVAFSLGGLFMRHIETQVWNVLFWRGMFSACLIFLVLALR